jgi:lactoylglutathione lyase
MSLMKLNHIAVWVKDLEILRAFYMKYFNLKSGEKYTNPAKQYSSYFLRFNSEDTRIELMHNPAVENRTGKRGFQTGLAHIAISAGSKEKVDELTERLRADKFVISGEPRVTGDGCYESVVIDPEGNWVEITI